ncbi:MAG: DUF885 domain-containing protein [Terracidiphilus sp.]|jgi:uncharacterized protein (DUF885 family)
MNRRIAEGFLIAGVVLAIALEPYKCLAQDPSAAKPSSAATQLDEFFAAEWEYQLEHSPEFATYVGDTRFNDRMNDYSAEAEARTAEHAERQLERLKTLPSDGLNEQQTISREIMQRQLEATIERYRLKEWEMPVSQMNGVHLDIAAMYAQVPLHTTQDYRNYITRLRQVPRVFDQVTDVMKLGMHDHLMQPRYLLEKVAVEAQEIASSTPEKSPFAQPLLHFPAEVSASDQRALKADLLTVISKDVLPAYSRFAVFVRDTYAPAGRTDPGIWALPNGDALYRNAIREHVQTTMDADAIFDEGMREVHAIEAQMLALAKTQGYNDLPSFHAHIQADPKLHATSAEQLLSLYQHYEDQSRAKITEVVPVAPTLPLKVVPMDSFRAPDAVPADYSPGSIASGRPGKVNVNLFNPPGRLLLNLEAIAYHEGMPGHHLQFSYADELKGLPEFRRYVSYDAYSEGWALYAELLGKELGFYQDPYSEYGRLENEMWRAIRLVVDTGVHAKHWTRQQMVDFFKDHTAMDDQNIQSEVDRYISWPGQALSYRLGQQKILELRERARKELGARFDVRQFHARVLSLGPVPLDVLDASVTRWIDAESKAGK